MHHRYLLLRLLAFWTAEIPFGIKTDFILLSPSMELSKYNIDCMAEYEYNQFILGLLKDTVHKETN
ncbi:hypothetical protein HNO89_004322 [Sporosarcina luteola]|nr:hypothetical protein [Sporosarcina luteola]